MQGNMVKVSLLSFLDVQVLNFETSMFLKVLGGIGTVPKTSI